MTKFFHRSNRFAQKFRQRPALSKASALPCPVAGFSTSCDASGPFGTNIEVSQFPATPLNVSGGTFGNTVTLRAGVTFVPISNNPVTDITFRVDGPGAGFDQCKCDIYATSGGLPTGASLGTSNAFTLGITSQYVKFVFATPVAVTSGVTYAAVLSRTGAQDGANAYDLYRVASGGTFGMLTENSSNVWSSSSVYPMFWVGTSKYKYWAIGRDATTATTLKAIGADDPSKSWPYAVYKTGFTTSIATIFTRQYQDILHIVISDGATNYKYQTFDMKTGTFVTAETIFSGLTIVTSAQASIVVRQELPAGEVVVHFNGTAVSSHARTYYTRRTAAATWSAAVQIDPGSPSTTDFNNQSSVLGASDRVHFLYTDNTTGVGYHRSLDNGNTLDTNLTNTTVQPNGVQPVSYKTSASVVKVQNSNQTGAIAEMHFDSGASPAIGVQAVTQTGRSPTSPHRCFVDVSIDDTAYTYYASYILYVDSVNNDIYATKSTDHGVTWDTTGSIVIYSGTVSTGGLNFCIGSTPYVRGGNVVIPMIFVEGGAHKYYEYTLRSAAVAKKIDATTAGSYSLTAPVATLLRAGHRMVATTPASYAVTGSNVSLRQTLTATTAGSYSLTAPVATLLRVARKVDATTAASYALTGVATTLVRHGWKMVATTAGSYALTGATTTKMGLGLVATTVGSYTLTGTPATLTKAKWLVAGTASYTLTGVNQTLTYRRLINATTAGAYSIIGSTVKLSQALTASAGSYALTGASTTLLRKAWRLIATTAGSYALTGTAAGVLHGWKLNATTAGSYALTGTDAGLTKPTAKNVVAGVGSYLLTGTAANFKRTYVMSATTAGSYALTGTAALTRKGYVATAGVASYALTGATTTLLRHGWAISVTPAGNYALTGAATTKVLHGWKLTAGVASYALTGSSVGLAQKLTASAGSYVLTGQSVGVRKGKILTAGVASYTLTGSAVGLAQKLTASAGSYTLTGTPATLRHAWIIAAGTASYTLTGAATTKVLHGWKVPAGVASYTLTGTATTKVLHGWKLTAGVASYTLTGSDVNLVRAAHNSIIVIPGVYTLTGTDAILRKSKFITAVAGSYILTGTAAGLKRGRMLAANTNSYTLTGTDAVLRHGWKIAVTPAGNYAVAGTNVLLLRGRKLGAGTSSYLLTGSPVTFTTRQIIAPSLYLDPDQFFTHSIKYNQVLQPGLFIDPDRFFTHVIDIFYGDTEVMYVPEEIRRMVLDVEDRLLEVPLEDKFIEVLGEERTMMVPPQPRETDVDRGMEVLDEETMMQAPVRRRA